MDEAQIMAYNRPRVNFTNIINACNSLVYKVGPQGFEPWTKGL